MLKIQVVGSKFLPEYAGPGFRILATYRRLVSGGAKLQWNVITGSTEFSDHASYTHNGIEVERIATPLFQRWSESATLTGRVLRALRSWLEAARLWRLLLTRRFDLLHVYGSSSITAAAILFAAIHRTPIVIELVTTKASALQCLPGLRIASFLRRRLARRCLIVAISQALADRSAAEGFRRNVWVRPNPVDTSHYFPEYDKRAAFRAQCTPFTAADVVMGMVAKFMPQKNQLFLIDVVAALPDQFKLVLAGPVVTQGLLAGRDRAYISALRQRAIDLGCERRVHIVTEFVIAENYMKSLDVYLLPNRDEGLATPMLESLACGVPVIGNIAEAAFRQWIDDGRNGFLHPLDAVAWGEAIQRAAQLSPAMMLDVAAQIREIASSEKIDGRFLHLLETLAALPSDKELDVVAELSNRR